MKVIPFSNGTEGMRWMDNNCDICRTKCHFERNMSLGFVSGDITLKTAEFIGYDINKSFNELKNNDYVNLFNLCQNRHKYKRKKRKKILKNQYKLNF